jgi:putative ABC transport system permease protein
MPDWPGRIRERLAAEGLTPSEHGDAIEEIAQHLDHVHRAAIRAGQSEDDAMAAADRELNGMQPLAHAMHRKARRYAASANRGTTGFAGLSNDVRLALRLMVIRPGYAALTVLTLAVGIGASTAVFSVFDGMLLRPLPFADPDRLVLLWERDRDDPTSSYIAAAPNYFDWVAGTRSFESLGLWEQRTFNVAGDLDPEQMVGVRASASLFAVLGITPARGRRFTTGEESPGQALTVISHAVWQTQFAGDPGVIGRTLRLNGIPHEVIGVLPPGLEFPRKGAGIWVPIGLTERDLQRDSHSFYVAARLKPGVTMDEARAEMDQIGRALAGRHPDDNDGESATATRMSDFGIVRLRSMLTAVLGAVLFVLAIACVNVANLQIGRAFVRRREFVVRLSLGAGLARLARQLLAESLALSALGGAGGLALAWLGTRAADLILTPGFRTLPLRGEVALVLDERVIGFAVLLSMASALFFGFAPLVGLRGTEPHSLLRAGDRGSTRFASGARRALVAVEVGLAVVVLCAAGLMIRSLTALFQVEPGLDPSRVLTMQVSLPQSDTYGPPTRRAFCADLSREVGSLPGVVQVSAMSHLPFSGANAGRGLRIEGRPEPLPGESLGGNYRLACPGYFGVMKIPILEGRDFSEHDTRDREWVVILNRAMAERYWPGASPIGQRVRFGGGGSEQPPWMTVVGIVENVRHFSLDQPAARELYRPYSQGAWPVMNVVAKTTGEPLLLQRAVREALRRVEPDLPAAGAISMEQMIAASEGWRETPLRLMTAFAAIGLLLAGVGVYGVLAYYVSQRTREIGVRVALGASRRELIVMVVRQSLAPIAAGLVAGVAGSVASGRLLAGLLYEVQPGDPWVTGSIAAVVAGAALLASWIPARRAAAVDPLVALREE